MKSGGFLGYRKFTVAMTSLAMGFALAWTGKLTTDFVTLSTIAVGAFTIANAAAKFKLPQGIPGVTQGDR